MREMLMQTKAKTIHDRNYSMNAMENTIRFNEVSKEAQFYEDPQSYGTEAYHRLTLAKDVIFTDGVKLMAEKMECFWLLTVIASHISYKTKTMDDFMSAYFIKGEGSKGEFFLMDDFMRATQKIPYTDIEKNVHLFIAKTEMNGNMYWVVMLPSEY
jgi:hypothetical protein